MEDALTLAAFFRVLVVHASELPFRMAYDQAARSILEENRWGVHGRFIVEGVDGNCTSEQWLALAQQRYDETAERLKMPKLFERARKILAGGTSADRQLCVYDLALKHKQHARSALSQVVDLLLQETLTS